MIVSISTITGETNPLHHVLGRTHSGHDTACPSDMYTWLLRPWLEHALH